MRAWPVGILEGRGSVPVSTGWRCPKCQLGHDETRHTNGNPDANEVDWLLENVRRAVEMLRREVKAAADGQGADPPRGAGGASTADDWATTARAATGAGLGAAVRDRLRIDYRRPGDDGAREDWRGSGGRLADEDDQTWLLSRIGEVVVLLEKLRCHKERTWHFARYEKHLAPRKNKEVCCEGMQLEISVGGSYFIQNPPAGVRTLYPGVACDDSRQNPFSVRSVMELHPKEKVN
ncbi:hypothetical protein M885DRAFT_557132 [Pelagophyceae sp. CCMP2097]|nr:hypothetical protein M885DRAFT_557132 [Pelagophyceae sp. CCMP2097]